MNSIVKKRFDLQIDTEQQAVSQTFQLDKNVVCIKGVLLTSDKDDLMYYRGSARLEVNKNEIFPEHYEAKLLMCGINLSPHLRYYETGSVPVGNGIVKLEYKDRIDMRALFEPYRVSLYLSLEQTE